MIPLVAKHWWSARSSREQILLGAMSLILAIVLGFYGVLAPLRQGARDSIDASTRSAAALVEAQAAADRIQALNARSATAPAGSALNALLNDTAAQAGVTIDRTQPASDGLTIWTSGDPRVLFAWLETLQNRHGLGLGELTATPGPSGGVQIKALLASPRK